MLTNASRVNRLTVGMHNALTAAPAIDFIHY